MSVSFEELDSLVRVISHNKVKQIEIVGEQSSRGEKNQIQNLYSFIAENGASSEEKAMSYFFEGEANRAFYFNRLKRKLRKRLINTLFFIDVNQPKFNEIQKAYYLSYKDAAAVKILIGRGARKPAIALAEKTIKKSLKFEFTDITLELARNLRMHFGNIEGNRKKFLYYKDIIDQQSKIYNAELIAEEYYCELAINFAKSQSSKPELTEIAIIYYNELRTVLLEHNSYKLNLHAYLLFALRYEIQNDYNNTLKVCQEAISYFESKPHIASKAVIFNFLLKEIVCSLITRSFVEGEQISKKCLKLQPKGSINWLVAMDYYIILLFHSNRFEEAQLVYLDAINELNVDNRVKGSSEHWKIHGAFLQYLVAIGKVKNSNETDINFRLSKFLNEVPTHSKDKQGINISILIIQILFLLHKGKHGEIIDRTESLKTYTHRYLRRDDTFRSNCFIKMLLCLPAASFHKAGVIRKAKKYVELLRSVPIQEANQSPEVEIIPYETLWEFVLESLDHKFH